MTVSHTMTRTCVINGVTHYPSEAEPILTHVGVTHEAYDGTATNVITGTKRRWSYRWDSPRPEVVEQLKAAYAAMVLASVNHTDPNGATYAAICPLNGLRYRQQHGDAGTRTLTAYPLELEVWER